MEKMKLVKVVKKADAEKGESEIFGNIYAEKFTKFPGGSVKLPAMEYTLEGIKKLLPNLIAAKKWLEENK